MKREILLLLAGAIISLVATFLTNFYNEHLYTERQNIETQKQNIERKMAFNRELADFLGKRLIVSWYFYKMKRDNKDSSVVSAEYKNIQYEYYSKKDVYSSFIQLYYGRKIRDKYEKDIYNPLIWFGNKAVKFNQGKTRLEDEFMRINRSQANFINELFDIAQK